MANKHIRGKRQELHAEMFVWLFRQSSDPVVQITIASVMASPRAEDLVLFQSSTVTKIIHQSISDRLTERDSPMDQNSWDGFSAQCNIDKFPVAEVAVAHDYYGKLAVELDMDLFDRSGDYDLSKRRQLGHGEPKGFFQHLPDTLLRAHPV